MDALDISKLVQQLQEERAAVALNNFLLQEEADQSISKETIQSLSTLTSKDLGIEDLNKALNLSTRCIAFDVTESFVFTGLRPPTKLWKW
jgi:hypothetical protein